MVLFTFATLNIQHKQHPPSLSLVGRLPRGLGWAPRHQNTATSRRNHGTRPNALMTLVFGCGLAIINGFYAQRRAYFTLGIDSPHHGLSNELLYVAIARNGP